MKLAVKITLIEALVMSLLIGSMVIIAVVTSQSGLEQKIGDAQLQLAEVTMDKIDRTLHGALQDIRAMAEDEEFEGALAGENDFKKSNEKLGELVFLTGPWDELEIFNNEGIVVAAVDEEEIGSSREGHSDEENQAFNAVMKGEIYISDVVISEDTGRPTVIFAAPVRDPNQAGKPVIGAVIGNFAWPAIEEILQEINAEAHLYNNEGFIIADSEAYYEGQILTEKVPLTNIAFQHAIEGSARTIILDSSSKDPGAYHEEVLISHAPQQGHLTYNGHGWVLLVETPTEIAFAPVKKITQRLLIAGLGLLIITLLVAFFIARSITNPINKLKDSALKISRGNFGERIDVKTGDEIGELAETFDNMRYSLKMVIDEYEKMKGKGELVKKVKVMENKQAETIKKLRAAIAEQKIARAAEQKALREYRQIKGKTKDSSN
jgi:methyl-accepting chemotaxis protein